MLSRLSVGISRVSTADQLNGALAERAPDDAAVGGSGFSIQGTVLDCVAGKAELISDVQDFLKELDENPDLRAAATLRTLARIRTELERTPETCQLGDPIQMRLQDVLVVARAMLSRLR